MRTRLRQLLIIAIALTLACAAVTAAPPAAHAADSQVSIDFELEDSWQMYVDYDTPGLSSFYGELPDASPDAHLSAGSGRLSTTNHERLFRETSQFDYDLRPRPATSTITFRSRSGKALGTITAHLPAGTSRLRGSGPGEWNLTGD